MSISLSVPASSGSLVGARRKTLDDAAPLLGVGAAVHAPDERVADSGSELSPASPASSRYRYRAVSL